MNEFNDIKSKWVQRPLPQMPKEGYKDILKNSLYIKRKQRIGQIILMITIAVLIYFFFYISAFKNSTLTLGISLMVSTLLFRVIVEFFSQTKLKNLAPTLQAKAFNEKLLAYYQSRLYIHYLLTPLLFIGYVIGFIIMLPLFKLHLSPGFYQYIIISACLTFIFLIVLIAFQISKELRLMNVMKKDAGIG